MLQSMPVHFLRMQWPFSRNVNSTISMGKTLLESARLY